MVTGGRHAYEVNIVFDGSVHNRFYDVTRSQDDRRQSRHCGVYGRHRVSNVNEVGDDTFAGQKSAKTLNDFDRVARCR